jgi:xylulokinase
VAYDIKNRAWNSYILQEIELDRSIFPDAYPCDSIVGRVSHQASNLTGLRMGIPVVAGSFDTFADAVSCGIVNCKDTYLTMGSAMLLGVVHDKNEFPNGLMTFPYAIGESKKYLTTGGLTSGGALVKWIAELFPATVSNKHELGQIIAELVNEARKVRPGSDGLVALPYFMGERAPIWNPNARGVLFGLSLQHTLGHIARAFMESAGYGVRCIQQLATECCIEYGEEVVMVGGAAKNALWREILADITGKTMIEAKNYLGSALGAAIIAGVGVGAISDLSIGKSWIEFGEPITPDIEKTKLYLPYLEIFKSLYDSNKTGFEQILDIETRNN